MTLDQIDRVQKVARTLVHAEEVILENTAPTL